MSSIIVVFPKIENGRHMKDILLRQGFLVETVCTTGAQVLSTAQLMDGGIVVGCYRFKDMFYTELLEYLPRGFEMLLIASESVLDQYGSPDVMALTQPFKVCDLIDTLQMMIAGQEKRLKSNKGERKAKDQKVIDNAKQLLMERNHMTEEEAHRYIQKTSMDSGTNMVETAQMILILMGA